MSKHTTNQLVITVELRRAALIHTLNLIARIILSNPDVSLILPHLLEEINAHLTILEYADGQSSHE